MWSMVIALQLAGLFLTLSRGPLVGTAIALGVFLALTAISVGRHAVGRTALVLVILGIGGILVASIALGTNELGSGQPTSGTGWLN